MIRRTAGSRTAGNSDIGRAGVYTSRTAEQATQDIYEQVPQPGAGHPRGVSLHFMSGYLDADK